MGCQEELLVQKVCEIYEKIACLDCLKPSKDVNLLFTQLVDLCIPPSSIDVTKLNKNMQEMRSNLIRLCGEAEGHLESHFSTLLASTYQNPILHLRLFPYYQNYLDLTQLEYSLLSEYCVCLPSSVAFVGSGPLPLTSIVFTLNHLPFASVHNYDIDASANLKAHCLVSHDPNLSKRMFFHTTDIMGVSEGLKDYDVVFLAALVGLDMDEKLLIINHLAKFMAPGALLMLRSAHGARGFLYPLVNLQDIQGLEVLKVFHPTNEVINSVVVARKSSTMIYPSLDHKPPTMSRWKHCFSKDEKKNGRTGH
ncbi:probable nicotianamine synthase 4 [Malania oleifera]|uniref:probable nicotianamine synthase 4 n=1 Tax=Malania oleifera TaxID=397392 RepID=UPI0025AE71A4|nr:probable nicotianamine synthase 4 [Malania oleifera]